VVHEHARRGRLEAERERLARSTSRKATFGAIRAAWKSTECGIGALFVSVTRTVWPTRAWITGPGAVPPNVHAS
jgi:hypothetical protein